jgi:hypothetical protein
MAGDREGATAVLYFALVSKLRALVPQRKKLCGSQAHGALRLFALPSPSPNFPIKAVIKFLDTPDMVAASY